MPLVCWLGLCPLAQRRTATARYTAVCITGGYLTSYWNRPYFPDWCSDDALGNSATYDTMVRIAGSWRGFADAFKVIADTYGWTHVLLISNDKV